MTTKFKGTMNHMHKTFSTNEKRMLYTNMQKTVKM